MSKPATPSYRIVVTGLHDQSQLKHTAQTLASKLSATPDHIEAVLAHGRHVLARGLSADRTQAYLDILHESDVIAVAEDETELLAIELPVSTSSARILDADEVTITKLAGYEKTSGIFWIVLSIIQICTVYGVVAGVWNLMMGLGRLKFSKQIRRRESTVPEKFEGVGGFVLIGLVNLLLGGVIRIILLGFDFFIRDRVLSNRHLFDQRPDPNDAYEKRRAKRLAQENAKVA
jgi:hypothetical protein